MNAWTHRDTELEGEYVAICMAETSCGYQAVGTDHTDTADMLAGHYVTGHHASDWNQPLRRGR